MEKELEKKYAKLQDENLELTISMLKASNKYVQNSYKKRIIINLVLLTKIQQMLWKLMRIKYLAF